jgi:hypothetical protein
VVSVATSGDLLQWHVHLHVLSTDGAFSDDGDDGTFHPLARWDAEALMRLFRVRLLARLVEKHAISQELATKLMAWRHPGFSAHVADPIAADDPQALENLAGYVTRNPLSLQRLVYLDGQQAVIYKGLKHNQTLDHIPDPGKHRTLFYSYYANRVRGDRAPEEPAEGKLGQQPSSSPSTTPAKAPDRAVPVRAAEANTYRSPAEPAIEKT